MVLLIVALAGVGWIALDIRPREPLEKYNINCQPFNVIIIIYQ